MRRQSAALAVLLCASLLQGRQATLSCGTHPQKYQEELQLHTQSKRRLARDGRLRAAATYAGSANAALRADAGNIAIMDDTDGVIARRNPFNLSGKTLRFAPVAGGKYRFETAGDTFEAGSGTVIAGLGDDDTREVRLPFAFPFYGQSYSTVWVNSDGNLSFGAGDAAITDRSFGRFTSGAPRIAGLFRDLDPTRARTGVTTATTNGAFVVSWVAVPEYSDTGRGLMQSFQIRLFADGRMEVAFGEVPTREAVTGITPGRLVGTPMVVSFLNDPPAEHESTIAERFSGQERVDIFAAAQKFYRNHDDSYDFLVFYNNLGIEPDDDVVAYEVTVRNNRSGYGDEKVDTGAETGSKHRLQALMNMGPLSQYPRDPDARVPARQQVGDTPITTLAHEAGHLFLAFASVRDEGNDAARPMLGYQTAHWRFTFNSEASLLEGNRIQDNGPNASPRFLTTATVEGYSPLDQYLMGFRPPEEVPDTFLVTNARGTVLEQPRVGVGFDGERRNITIQEIIDAEGRRTPDSTVAQRRFRFAFILITAAGTEPMATELAQVEQYRTRFEEFFAKASSNRASADTSLRRALRVSLWPAAGVIQGSTATATVALERPSSAPVTVLLSSRDGNVRPPASVTIPAGAASASFAVTGVRPGTDEITARPADATIDAAVARMQVATPGTLKLTVAFDPKQSGVVRVAVTDVNELPYASVPVSIALTGGGTVDQARAVTGEDGTVAVRWTIGEGPLNELRASIAGGPTAAVTAAGRPQVSSEGVVNAASYTAGLTPGGIATMFGANLSGSTLQVLLNGRPVEVFYADARQVNFHVPFDTPPGTAELLVRNEFGSARAVQANVRATQPGIFFDSATGYGAVTTAGTGQVTQVRPVQRGGTIEVYATGLGAVEQTAAGLSQTLARPQATIGGVPALVTFSGLAPGYLGLYQVNVQVPSSVPGGAATLSLSVGSAASNEVRIEVR